MTSAVHETSGAAVAVTTMRRRHLPAVLEIEALVYPRPWSATLFQGELAQPSRRYVVAWDGERVVGYAGLILIVDDGHIATVAVHPDRQRQGIATRLILHLCRVAVAAGARQLTLEVRVSNRGAQELYRHFGFVPGGIRRAYYPDNREDALVMWAHDVDLPAYQARLDDLAGERSGIDPADGAEPVAAHPAAGGGRGGQERRVTDRMDGP